VRKLRRLGIPLVYSLTIVPNLPKNRVKRFFKVQMFRRHYRLMDALIVMCLYQERWLREIGIDKPITVVPNGVDAVRFRPPRDEGERLALRNKLGFAAEDEVLTTVGAVSPRKGTDLAIEALRLVLERRPHARLVVLGLRSDLINPEFAAFRRRLESLLADPWLAARVRFMGIVDNPNEYLRASDVYLFASHRESIPNSMFEAMASGLPTVIAPFLGWGEDCGEAGRDYLLAKHDPESLALAATKILEDSALRASLAKSGHAWTQEFMNPDIPLDRLAALYQQLRRPIAQV
jgi:glycosyltransferase involved in cell wall biosynthesis